MINDNWKNYIDSDQNIINKFLKEDENENTNTYYIDTKESSDKTEEVFMVNLENPPSWITVTKIDNTG